jgi:hypothetical protein
MAPRDINRTKLIYVVCGDYLYDNVIALLVSYDFKSKHNDY